jgi:hypothetical protein
MENVTQGQTLMLGITVDPEGDVVLLIVIGRDDATGEPERLAVALTPSVGANFADTLYKMSEEAQELQQELTTLTPQEAVERVEEIRARYSAGSN